MGSRAGQTLLDEGRDHVCSDARSAAADATNVEAPPEQLQRGTDGGFGIGPVRFVAGGEHLRRDDAPSGGANRNCFE
jgi:hypothetical protein